MPPGDTRPRLVDAYDAVLFDLDGVVYIGESPVAGAPETIRTLREGEIATAYLTNNASRPARDVAAHLRNLGVEASDDDVVTSAQAAARMLAGMLAPGSAVLTIGSDGLVDALRAEGLRSVWSAEDSPVAVVQGFGPDVGWRLLAEAVFAVRRGLPWVATNLDYTIPTPRGIGPGNGLLVGVVRGATGATPIVAGKPERALVDVAVARTKARHPLIVGDRLDTDIAAATGYGCDSLLVLSGVTTPGEFALAVPAQRATYVGYDISALLDDAPPPVELDANVVRCGGWSVRVAHGAATIDGDGPALHGLLALAHACWSALDRGETPEIAGALESLGFDSS